MSKRRAATRITTSTSARMTRSWPKKACRNFRLAGNQTPPRTSSRANELCMPTCEVCENEYDKAFEVVVGGERHTFDSFECAIHALAPVCPHCSCRIIGPRRRSGRKNLLLCPLRTRVRHNAVEGPRLSGVFFAPRTQNGQFDAAGLTRGCE